ncbi:limonene-1,2-epoxide hydrolase family protein [Mycobacterium sp. pV006]|uniref:limonene-1,2-epoxide hydrolase family protein n=1 Tax=Mycobacterium sp. pV006 TaxID=3238983 RepID=UPI00351AB6FB
MTRTPEDIVTEFCAKWSAPDPEELASYFTEDGVYHNIPMEPAVGHDAIKAFIGEFTAMTDGIDFVIHRQVSSGALVFNERTDVLRLKDGRQISLPVAGVFEIVDGRIAAWRDYFDMEAVMSAFV